MRKIAVSISKGGVAKSSTSVSIAHGLAIKGKRVLLIDTDDQGQDSFLLGVLPRVLWAANFLPVQSVPLVEKILGLSKRLPMR